MQIARKALAIIIVGAAGASIAAAQGTAPRDVTGKWLFTVQSDAGSGTPTVTFEQRGDSLSGHYSSQIFGEVDFKGSVKDGKFTFSFGASVEGSAFTVTYSGALDGPDAMKGTVGFEGLGTGTFTAKRIKSSF